MVNAAVAVATGKANLASTACTLARLREGDIEAANAFRHELARQVAAALLMLDPAVLEVYQEHTRAPSDANVGPLALPLKLWVIASVRNVDHLPRPRICPGLLWSDATHPPNSSLRVQWLVVPAPRWAGRFVQQSRPLVRRWSVAREVTWTGVEEWWRL
jgi:hypothetical protein